MSSIYTPSPVDLLPYTIPSDGDGPHIKAADVDPALEALGDGIKYVSNRKLRQTLLTAASGTWTVPADVIDAMAYLVGGGGGGGGGANGINGADTWPYGGGGGGAAHPIFAPLRNLTPGDVLLYVCGNGGTAGAGGVFGGPAATAGGNGGDSGVLNPAATIVLANGDGAKGGRAGVGYQGVTIAAIIPGGSPSSYADVPAWLPCAYHLARLPNGGAGHGGASSPLEQFLVGVAAVGGGLALGSQAGGRQSPRSYAAGGPFVGGAAGADGVKAGPGPFQYGGVGGGGGAGGCGGSGGGGGAGGNGTNPGAGVNGNPGGAGSNGGGGGGGGGGGCGTAGATAIGGDGGPGGRGHIVIVYVSSHVAVFT